MDGYTFLDLKKRVPALYQDEEFEKFLDACSEAIDILRREVRAFPEIIDPRRTRAAALPHLLRQLGWSEPWQESEAGQRKLARFLSRLLRQRGTNRGIANMIRLIVGIECEVRNQPRTPEYGYPWPPGSREWHTFEIIPPREITEAEELAIRRCADYMKPSHTFYRILPPYDHWELGISEIDTQATLH